VTLAAPAFWPSISRRIWETRYRFSDEREIGATWERVAAAAAEAEGADQAEWKDRFLAIMDDFRFLPAGRILAGAGTQRQLTLFNCFVMGVIEDSLPGILRALSESALTMQQGGGIGCDFSTLRPEGMSGRIFGEAGPGPVAFMKVWDAMCATMLSSSARRGAMMATLRCDHPDIGAFIEAKRQAGALRHFNLSVQITDEFMDAVSRDAEWPLVFPTAGLAAGIGCGSVFRRWTGSREVAECRILTTVRAADLWEQILRAAFDTAEPGVLFIDRINHENNLREEEWLTATNPCGEVPLPPYGACNLGSLNLTKFVIDPFQPSARLDLARLVATTKTAVRFLDNVIDISAFPLPEQAQQELRTRRLGLGITGLGDALAMLGQRYDSWTARGVAEDLMRHINHAAYSASASLAEDRGACPAFNSDAFMAAEMAARLPIGLREAIARNGLRNSHLLAVAPAGTISILAGNVSSGIEPVFALEADRTVLGPGQAPERYRVCDYAWDLWRRSCPESDPPDSLLEAAEIAPKSHLEMQAALQPWVDAAISKTVNVARDFPFEQFRALYRLAYDRGLKGCTVFRPNALRGAILAATDRSEECCR